MFWVINKEKLYAYMVTVVTVITLFSMSYMMENDENYIQETSVNILNETE